MKNSDIAYDGAKVEWYQRHVHSVEATIGHVSYNPGGYCGPRSQRDFELVLLQSGSCQATVDELSFPLQLDKVYLLTPRHQERFEFSHTQKSRHFWCSISSKAMPPEMKRALLAASTREVVASECFHRLLSAAFLLRMTESEASQQVVDRLAIALFAEFLHGATHVQNKTDPVILGALRHMESHLAEEDCLKEAKRLSGYSNTAFIYKFKAFIGTTPARHLWKMRVEKGVQLLAETGLTIAEIAYHCGFKNPFHFSRMVRQLQGISPRAIRKSAWK
jgi:AraC-like DNA-binding protein